MFKNLMRFARGQSEPSSPSPVWVWVLGVLLLVAFVLRILIVRHGLPMLLYEDEPIYLDHALRFGLGDWDLHYFKKPSFFLYFYGFFYGLVWLFSPFLSWKSYVDAFWEDPALVASTGRIVSVLFATGTVWLTYRIGKRLFTPLVGLAAAFLLAVNPTHLQISPIVISDIPSLCCIVASAWFALDVVEKGRWRDYLLCAGLIALTVSFKYNVFTASFLVAAHFVRAKEQSTGAPFPWRQVLLDRKLWGSLLAIPAIFFLLNPLALVNASTFFEHLNTERLHMLQRKGGEAGPGWRFMASFGKIFARILPDLINWAPYAVGFAGVPWLLWRYRFRAWVLLALPVVFILVVSQFRLINAKYLLPVLPFWCLAAAVVLQDALFWLVARLKFSQPLAVVFFIPLWLGISWTSLHDSLMHVKVFQRPDTRNHALIILRDRVQLGERVFSEPDTVPLEPRFFRSMVTIGDWRGNGFDMLVKDDMQMANIDIREVRPDYVLMILKAKKFTDQHGNEAYRMVYQPAYYQYVQANYQWVQLFSPLKLDVDDATLKRIQAQKGFVALTRAIKDHEEGKRRNAGPLMLLMKRKSASG